MPGREIHGFLDRLAVKARHDKRVQGDESEVVLGKKRFQTGDGLGLLSELGDDRVGNPQLDRERRCWVHPVFDREQIGFQHGLELGEGVVGKRVKGVA